MKRLTLWSSAFALIAMVVVATPARAQMGMSMGNGWSFGFSGNVNAFAIYENSSTSGTTGGPLSLVPPPGTKGFDIRGGMLPAMATLSARGRDDGRDLSAVFTFAPEIQCGGGSVSCTGSQLDVRQAFMTIGGVHGGTLLAGRDLGLFGRGAIMNDMTMFGTGPTGGPGGAGTTLGRFGTGYNYPNYTAQMTWSSAAGKSTQFAIGLFDPTPVANFAQTQLPRVEAQWMSKGASNNIWIEGLVQSSKDVAASKSLTSAGGSAGIKWWNQKVTIVATGFFGSGLGTTTNLTGAATDGATGRTTFGGYGQAMFVMNQRTNLGVSYGLNQIKGTSAEGSPKFTNSSIVAGLYNKYGKALRSTLEATYLMDSDNVSGNKNDSGFNLSAGVLLFW